MSIIHYCSIIPSLQAPLGVFRACFLLARLAPRYEHAGNTSLKVKVCVLVRHLWAAVAVTVSDSQIRLPWLHLCQQALRWPRRDRKYWPSPFNSSCVVASKSILKSAQKPVCGGLKRWRGSEGEGTRSAVPNIVGG